MGFKNNFSQAEQNTNLKPQGDYEVIITKAEERQTRNGKLGLNFSLVIRNDVEQQYKNGYLFLTLWKRKEPTEADLQVNGYSFGQIMNLGKSAGLPDGKDYESLEDFLRDLIGKPMRVHVKHETYNGATREAINFINPSKFPTVNHVMKQQASADSYAAKTETYANQTASTGFQEIPVDDDLPF